MYDKALKKLQSLQLTIDQELKTKDPSIETIKAKTAQYCTFLINNEGVFMSIDQSENKKRREIYNELKRKGNEFKSKIKEFELSVNEELTEVIADYEFNEKNINNNRGEESEFVVSNTRRLNNFIVSAIDNLDSLKRQRVYIENTRERIRNGLVRLGVGSEVVDKISSRYLTDYYFFWAMVAVVILLFILIKYFL